MTDPLDGMDYADRVAIGVAVDAEWFLRGGRELTEGEQVFMAEHIASWLWDLGFQIVKRPEPEPQPTGIGDDEGDV